MDNFLFRFFDTVWEAIMGAFRKKRNTPKSKKKKKK